MEFQKLLETFRLNKAVTNSYLPDVSLFDKKGNPVYDYLKSDDSIIFFKETAYSFRQVLVFVKSKCSIAGQNIQNSVFEFIRPGISSLSNEVLHNWALKNGFVHYKTFQRMAFLRKEKEKLDSLVDIEHPKDLEDLTAIKTFLEDNFDIFAERIPSVEELKSLITGIYLIRDNRQIAALLISEKKGVTEELRYWLVKKEFRKKKYGGALMRYFLNKNGDTKRFVLWVDNTNEEAIDKYKHFGFSNDKIINEIYITKDLR
ncbi:GCN5-related N-acetyltransferase [Flavobacterium daejeonense]|nr:GCN5-related N-acetyltransferase [Flavobacterium daejeonense]